MELVTFPQVQVGTPSLSGVGGCPVPYCQSASVKNCVVVIVVGGLLEEAQLCPGPLALRFPVTF